MLKNYIKIAWRNITRNKTHSSINIAGLAIGMTSFILILLYIQDELKFDKFLNKADQIYQVDLNSNSGNGEEFYIGKTPASVSSALIRNFPEIEYAARAYRPGELIIRSESSKTGGNYFTESSVLGVDSGFLNIFSFRLLKGDRLSCLQQPNSIVITKETAKKYFGDSESIGKILFVGKDRHPLLITGVLEDLPSQSTLQFDMLANIAAFPVVQKMSWSWVWLQVCTYVKLKDNTPNQPGDIKKLEAKFPLMIKVEAASAFKRIGQPLEELIKKGGKWELYLQPFTNIHLYSAGIGQVFPNVSDIKYVYIFSVIALFIIILACLNFMNLSTAQSSKRAKEVGVRKVLGSEKKQLVNQFLAEALLFSFSAAFAAMLLVAILIQPFNSISGKNLQLSDLFSGGNLLLFIGLIGLTGLLAGSYPAFYLASFKPGVIIKGLRQVRSGFSDFFIRNTLVVFQFAVSTTLIICTLVVFKQLRFMQDKDLGLDKENVIIIRNSHLLGDKEKSFKHEIALLPGINKVSIATGVPTQENFGDGYIPEISTPNEKLIPDLSLSSFMVDEDFIPSLSIQLLKGRNFSKEFFDSTAVILNEEAVKVIGWKNPVGSFLTYPGNNNQRFKVIGVVKNFNVTSLHNPVQPFALFHTSSKTYNIGTSYILVRNKPGDMTALLENLKEKWEIFAPSTPFDISFLDNEFDALYRMEQRVSKVFFIFTALSIFVACLGLLGLAIYSTETRTKEIGIRKVLGAKVHNIITLLSTDFIKLVMLATLFAIPFAWWCMNVWLEDFAYRIKVEWWFFILALFISMALTLLTISWQTFKAAISNPVKSLRNE